jgi:hypothetical protein
MKNLHFGASSLYIYSDAAANVIANFLQDHDLKLTCG